VPREVVLAFIVENGAGATDRSLRAEIEEIDTRGPRKKDAIGLEMCLKSFYHQEKLTGID